MGQVITPAFPPAGSPVNPQVIAPADCCDAVTSLPPEQLPERPLDGRPCIEWHVTAMGTDGHKRRWRAFSATGVEVAQEVEARMGSAPTSLTLLNRGPYHGPFRDPVARRVDVSHLAKDHRAAAWLGHQTQVDTELDQADQKASDSTFIHSHQGRLAGTASWIGAVCVGLVVLIGLGIAARAAWTAEPVDFGAHITRPAADPAAAQASTH